MKIIDIIKQPKVIYLAWKARSFTAKPIQGKVNVELKQTRNQGDTIAGKEDDWECGDNTNIDDTDYVLKDGRRERGTEGCQPPTISWSKKKVFPR